MLLLAVVSTAVAELRSQYKYYSFHLRINRKKGKKHSYFQLFGAFKSWVLLVGAFASTISLISLGTLKLKRDKAIIFVTGVYNFLSQSINTHN